MSLVDREGRTMPVDWGHTEIGEKARQVEPTHEPAPHFLFIQRLGFGLCALGFALLVIWFASTYL